MPMSPSVVRTARMCRVLPAVCAVVALLASSASAQTISTFDTGPGTVTFPTAINASGTIVGQSLDLTTGLTSAFVRTAKGDVTRLGIEGVSQMVPMDINAGGRVVGIAVTSAGASGFVADANGHVELVDVPGTPYTLLTGINGRGTLIGAVAAADFSSAEGVVISGGLVERVTIPGAEQVVPTAINEAGTVVGYYYYNASAEPFVSDNRYSGFVRDHTGVITTFDLPAPAGGHVSFIPGLSINASGTVAGSYEWIVPGERMNTFGYHAFVRDRQGHVTIADIETATVEARRAITASGTVIGRGIDPSDGQWRNFTWSRHGDIMFLDLSALPSALATATNAAGTIVGFYADPATSQVRGWILR